MLTVYGRVSGTQEELDTGDVVRVSYIGELAGTDTRQMKVQKIEPVSYTHLHGMGRFV